ncbi:hypothetical protein PtA15_2A202 [Puccinia triticina]|uniref:Uncharacterized protein n=1 Tax=Puccinia triticina TaxID=208348 RepID=A0ABY7CA33_9BASI|nr:uncharacterized protein PtA15_2A202 [Puccinia triticina]WAQ81889.1 hypothetical protein PtA15_2A202 [Puccinia triticina]
MFKWPIQRCRQLHPASLVEEPQAWLATFAFVHSSPSQPICLPLRQHHIISSISQPLRFQRPLTTVQSDHLRIALYDQPTKYRRTAVPSTCQSPPCSSTSTPTLLVSVPVKCPKTLSKRP